MPLRGEPDEGLRVHGHLAHDFIEEGLGALGARAVRVLDHERGGELALALVLELAGDLVHAEVHGNLGLLGPDPNRDLGQGGRPAERGPDGVQHRRLAGAVLPGDVHDVALGRDGHGPEALKVLTLKSQNFHGLILHCRIVRRAFERQHVSPVRRPAFS